MINGCLARKLKLAVQERKALKCVNISSSDGCENPGINDQVNGEINTMGEASKEAGTKQGVGLVQTCEKVGELGLAWTFQIL